MNAALLCGRLMRHCVQPAITCHRVFQQCMISTSSVAAQMHTSLHQFTDDERMMGDTGICLLTSVADIISELSVTFCFCFL